MKEGKTKLFSEFKKFIARGNVVDLAVAMVVGAAFNKIVSQLVDSFITPLIGIILGGFSLDDMKYVYKEAVLDTDGVTVLEAEISFTYGAFIQTVIDFLLIALTVFIVVKLYNALKKHIEEEYINALSPEEELAKQKAEEERIAKEQAEKAEREAKEQAEIERKNAEAQAQREYFMKQQELLTEIRDSLQTK